MKYFLSALVVVLVLFNLFGNITHQAVAEFDEARHVASAVEMVRDHGYLVTHYMGSVDYWNAKPPLSEWGSALGYSVFSNPFLGVRFFSLLAAMVCCLAVFAYTRRLAGWGAALLAVVLLITARSLILSHGARTADADMLFIGLVTLAMLACASGTRLHVGLAYVALGLAFLAKSLHVAPYALVIFLYTGVLWRQQRLGLRDVLLLPCCGLLPVLPWALARYQVDGWNFFRVMLLNDVIKRSTSVIEGQVSSQWLYFNRLMMAFGLLVLTPFTLLLARHRHRLQDSRIVLLLLWVLVPLCVYSLARSRLPWYIYPAFPGMAVLIAVALENWLAALPRKAGWVLVGVVVLSIGQSETIIAGKILRNQVNDNPVAMALSAISAASGAATAKVYLQADPMPFRQHEYATALLLGNIELQVGGEKAFLAAGGPQRFLVAEDGRIMSR